jgi:hypothetical protein
MATFRPFEIEALRLLCESALPTEVLTAILATETAAPYEYTGCGYYLTVRHACLASETHTLSRPAVIGVAGDVVAGFIVHVVDGALTLECHTWGAVDVPPDFRERSVSIGLLRHATPQ